MLSICVHRHVVCGICGNAVRTQPSQVRFGRSRSGQRQLKTNTSPFAARAPRTLPRLPPLVLAHLAPLVFSNAAQQPHTSFDSAGPKRPAPEADLAVPSAARPCLIRVHPPWPCARTVSDQTQNTGLGRLSFSLSTPSLAALVRSSLSKTKPLSPRTTLLQQFCAAR